MYLKQDKKLKYDSSKRGRKILSCLKKQLEKVNMFLLKIKVPAREVQKPIYYVSSSN